MRARDGGATRNSVAGASSDQAWTADSARQCVGHHQVFLDPMLADQVASQAVLSQKGMLSERALHSYGVSQFPKIQATFRDLIVQKKTYDHKRLL